VISSSPESTGSDNGNDISIDQCVFLISPVDYAQRLSLTPYLDWGDVFGANSYSLQLARDLLFTDIVVDLDNISESEYTILIDHLDNGETYYWRVMAEFDNYTTGWSDIRRFTTFEVDYRNIISFQGLITGNNEIPIADGDVAVTFRLYESFEDETSRMVGNAVHQYY
jgi:hypothetical protein